VLILIIAIALCCTSTISTVTTMPVVPPHPTSCSIARDPTCSFRFSRRNHNNSLPKFNLAAPAGESESAPTRAAAAAVRGKNARKKSAPPAAPVVLPDRWPLISTPQGAQVQLDGKTDPSWVTPFTLSGLGAGQHTVTVSKPGYSTDTRTVDVASGGKAFVTSRLAQLMATLSVTSTPPGANVYIDGRDTGKLTPAQVSVDKGQHVVLVRKPGFVDETTSAQFVLAQTVSFFACTA